MSLRIVSLEPFITQTAYSLKADALVGVSSACPLPEDPGISPPHRLPPSASAPDEHSLIAGLASWSPDLAALAALVPDIILTRCRFAGAPDENVRRLALERSLADKLGRNVSVRNFAPQTLDDVYEFFQELGTQLGAADKGRALAHRLKAQCMDWADNFYDRMRNKRVLFISAVAPFAVAGGWLADLIRLCSAEPLSSDRHQLLHRSEWPVLAAGRPDVIIVAPCGSGLRAAASELASLQRLPGWDELPAVKRGEVYFCGGGRCFYEPTPQLRVGAAIIVSCIAGLESGYITERDSFVKMRWLELHRHRIDSLPD